MSSRALLAVLALITAAVAQANGTATFRITGGSGVTTQEATISLSVAKVDKKEIVTPPPTAGDNQVSGTHTFPAGTSTGTVAQYYRGLLNNAGWIEGTDFTTSGDGINFFGITKLDGTSDGQIKVSVKKDVAGAAYGATPQPHRIRFERSEGHGQDGVVTILAFGIKWDEASKRVNARLGEVHVRFLSAESAGIIIERIANSMTEHGWIVSLANGAITITSSGDGAQVYSFWLSPEYFGEGSNKDKWTIEEVR